MTERNLGSFDLPPGLTTEDNRLVFPAVAVAQLFKLSPTTIQRLVKEEKIYGVKPAHDLFVSVEDLQSYLSSNRHAGGRPRKNKKI